MSIMQLQGYILISNKELISIGVLEGKLLQYFLYLCNWRDWTAGLSRNGNHIISRENILCCPDSLSMRLTLGSTVRWVHCDLEVISSKYGNNLSACRLRLHASDPFQTCNDRNGKPCALGLPLLDSLSMSPS